MGLEKYNCAFYTFPLKDNSIILTFDNEFKWFGFTILKNKYLKKKKLLNFEHVLISKDDLKKLKDFINIPDRESSLYIECQCHSEILRVGYDDNYKEFYFDIFDNYALKLKRGIDTFTSIPEEQAREFVKLLDKLLE